MIPEAFFELSKEEMPRLPSGKINAKGLHDISAKRRAQEEAAQAQISAAKSVASQESGNLTLDRILDGLASVFPHCKQVLAQDDIFDDLGGHSLVCAVLVSRLRCHPGLKQLGLADIYECRTAEAIAARFSDVDAASEFDEKTTLSAAAPPRDRPVSALRHALCGTAQLPVILFLFFIVSLEILMPYLLFDFLLSYGVASAIFGAYGVFVVLPPAVALCGVLGKWAFLGHAREGSHRLWGFQYFRWWAADRFTDLVPVKVSGTTVFMLAPALTKPCRQSPSHRCIPRCYACSAPRSERTATWGTCRSVQRQTWSASETTPLLGPTSF
jgi:hypothetical protein